MKNLVRLVTMLVCVWVVAQFTACAHSNSTAPDKPVAQAAPEAKGPSIEAKQLAASEQAPFVTEVKFTKNKQELTQASEDKLSKLLNDAQSHGQIEDVKVIAWADEEYPSVHTKKLSISQRALAKHRAEEIKSYVHKLDSQAKVDTYNMAERPGMIGETFRTENARVKKALEVAGIPNTDTSVKTPSKASKAIVLVILKE